MKLGVAQAFKRALHLGDPGTGRACRYGASKASSLPAVCSKVLVIGLPGPRPGPSTCTRWYQKERPGFVSLYVHYAAPSPDSTAKVAALELSLLHQDGGAHLTRRHEGKRVFGAKADLVKKISTSAGTAALAHVVLTQVEALGFVKTTRCC